MEKIHSAREGEAIQNGERWCIACRGFRAASTGVCEVCGTEDPEHLLDPEVAHREGWTQYLDDEED